MEGLKAICLTQAEGRALATALDAEGVHEHYADAVADHDVVKQILTHGGAIHVQGAAAVKPRGHADHDHHHG